MRKWIKEKLGKLWHFYMNPNIEAKGEAGRGWAIYILIIECRVLIPLTALAYMALIPYVVSKTGIVGVGFLSLGSIVWMFMFAVIPNIIASCANLSRAGKNLDRAAENIRRANELPDSKDSA